MQGCCPTVKFNKFDGTVEIKDDSGGTVTLSAAEFNELQQAVPAATSGKV